MNPTVDEYIAAAQRLLGIANIASHFQEQEIKRLSAELEALKASLKPEATP